MPEIRTMDLRELEGRLENWARAQRSGWSGAQAGSAEGNYRYPGVLYRDRTDDRGPVDHADAGLVNVAWQALMALDKDVLQMHYVWSAPASFICRRLKLKQGRGNEHVFDFALYHAHDAIWDRLQRNVVNAKNRAYNPRRLLNPASSE
ncbi:hypothetical protein D7S86_08225 [Pararobbsia silviterrae]|uniref:Uncharacterized protein n=2 Tax=Pararobbsia silviterrae TaxID=1792498 RepID=A0A494Y0S2_9BURK|nr:hypothetical protein D7S86_08225 [Pararobbsia silviterrae]